MDAFALRALRAEARAMRRDIDRVIHAADHRLGMPALDAAMPRVPLGTDWVWRGDAWRGPLSAPGGVAFDGRTGISDDLALFHDCALGEVAFRQKRNTDDADRAAFGLVFDVFAFRGTFLSLAIQLPQKVAKGFKARHLVRLDLVIDSDRPLDGYVRLNIKHGINLAKLVSDLPKDGREKQVEFDLAYAGVDEERVEGAWVDIIFKDPAMSRIDLCDAAFSRRPRAEL